MTAARRPLPRPLPCPLVRALVRPLVIVLALGVALLSACSDDSMVAWRDLTVRLPAGWLVFEEHATVLGIADGPLAGEDEEQPRVGAVAVQFQTQDVASADPWRELVTGDGGDIERDTTISVGGVPATQLVYSWTTNGIPTREMVVVVQSRSLVILMQPVPAPGDVSGPDTYLAHADEFDAILASIDFGAPADYQP